MYRTILVGLLALVAVGCVPNAVMSPIPATNPFDDRLWVEVYNHSDFDLLTVESRGAVVRGKKRGGEVVYALQKGETFEFPLISFRRSESYTLRIIGWRCEGELPDLGKISFAGCKQSAYKLERVSVPYSNRSGYRRVIEVRNLR